MSFQFSFCVIWLSHIVKCDVEIDIRSILMTSLQFFENLLCIDFRLQREVATLCWSLCWVCIDGSAVYHEHCSLDLSWHFYADQNPAGREEKIFFINKLCDYLQQQICLSTNLTISTGKRGNEKHQFNCKEIWACFPSLNLILLTCLVGKLWLMFNYVDADYVWQLTSAHVTLCLACTKHASGAPHRVYSTQRFYLPFHFFAVFNWYFSIFLTIFYKYFLFYCCSHKQQAKRWVDGRPI